MNAWPRWQQPVYIPSILSEEEEGKKNKRRKRGDCQLVPCVKWNKRQAIWKPCAFQGWKQAQEENNLIRNVHGKWGTMGFPCQIQSQNLCVLVDGWGSKQGLFWLAVKLHICPKADLGGFSKHVLKPCMSVKRFPFFMLLKRVGFSATGFRFWNLRTFPNSSKRYYRMFVKTLLSVIIHVIQYYPREFTSCHSLHPTRPEESSLETFSRAKKQIWLHTTELSGSFNMVCLVLSRWLQTRG